MYICRLIKNPQPTMSMQQIMRWGHDFLRIRGVWGGCLTWSNGGKPIKTVNYQFLVFFPNLLFLPEFGWGSYCMEWEEYGKNFELGRAPIPEERVLTSWEKAPRKCMSIPSWRNVFHFPSHVGSCGTFWIIDPSFTGNSHVDELSCMFILHVSVVFFIVHV